MDQHSPPDNGKSRPESMTHDRQPSGRKLVGIALILLLIGVWAAFVASLARIVGKWPTLVQALFYLIMGIAWIIPLKPLVRWIETGSFKPGSGRQD
jgi:predicted membrane channel-forming protein YqfA (hemolysin III family)